MLLCFLIVFFIVLFFFFFLIKIFILSLSIVGVNVFILFVVVGLYGFIILSGFLG